MEVRTHCREGAEARRETNPRIVAFLCSWCAYEGADAAGRGRMPVPAGLRPIRVPCSGRVEPAHVIRAFARGAHGVLILGCRPRECHYREGNLMAAKRVVLLRQILEPLGIEPERLGLAWVAAEEGERYARIVRDMEIRLRRLGPLGRFGDTGFRGTR